MRLFRPGENQQAEENAYTCRHGKKKPPNAVFHTLF
jgi:hypothetical protein